MPGMACSVHFKGPSRLIHLCDKRACLLEGGWFCGEQAVVDSDLPGLGVPEPGRSAAPSRQNDLDDQEVLHADRLRSRLLLRCLAK